MNDVTPDSSEPSVEAITETATHPDFDLILTHWSRIASTAWTGAITSGPGFVGLSRVDENVHIEYRLGSPCRCHPIELGSYDPAQQVVVVIRRPEETSPPMIFSGWPTPPDAYAALSADDDDATVH